MTLPIIDLPIEIRRNILSYARPALCKNLKRSIETRRRHPFVKERTTLLKNLHETVCTLYYQLQLDAPFYLDYITHEELTTSVQILSTCGCVSKSCGCRRYINIYQSVVPIIKNEINMPLRSESLTPWSIVSQRIQQSL
jgi:hypothetical protein